MGNCSSENSVAVADTKKNAPTQQRKTPSATSQNRKDPEPEYDNIGKIADKNSNDNISMHEKNSCDKQSLGSRSRKSLRSQKSQHTAEPCVEIREPTPCAGPIDETYMAEPQTECPPPATENLDSAPLQD